MTAVLKDNLQNPSLYLPTQARIQDIRRLTELEKLFTIQLPNGTTLNHRPGQFIEVSLYGIGEAPISISSSPSRSNGAFELCVRRAGDLTGALHQLQPGDTIGVRGPFGNGFPIERFRGKDVLFAAGGLGLAPARSLINEVLDNRSKYGRVIVLYGAKRPAELLFTDELAQWKERNDVELHLSVDVGDETWQGKVGVITTLFADLQIHARNTVAITVGPPVMYRYVLLELLGKGITEGNIWMSLERRMKCGVGKCGHCQLHHIYTCIEGPVFSYAQIKPLEEAL